MAISLTILRPQDETLMAANLINKLVKINKIDFDLEIIYDFGMKEVLGCHFLNQKHKIYINPNNCVNINEGAKNHFFYQFTEDLTINGVIIHEFCHVLTFQVFKGMLKDYKKTFPKVRLYLNDYADTAVDEEIAECMSIYISNPYLLKLISEDHLNFFKKYFTSPVPATQRKFFSFYKHYPIEIKTLLKEKWNIVYDVVKEKFEKVNVNKQEEHHEIRK